MSTKKTYSQQFMELSTNDEKKQFVQKNFDSWCKELDNQIMQANERIKRSEKKAKHFEAWLNLYELNPRLALKYQHFGIIKKS